ncbi:MAG: phosphoribosylamine--glycine ligase [Pseudomonadota bacterium]|nr:phosphoribosylamine--glycine ligase [Pseudomonadota bacterium]
MKILIIGNGGREHSFAWKCSQSNKVEKVFIAPGNGGTAQENKVQNINIGAEDSVELLRFAIKENIDLTIIGPEAPLVKGIVDNFNNAGLSCFGPTADAAQLEGSKSFTKDFLQRHKIPTADYKTFSESEKAIDYIHSKGTPIVIKADGLAAGKGVIVAMTINEATDAVKNILDDDTFGDAGAKIVVEEFLEGEEASYIVITDGNQVVSLATSQDHKARDNGDLGPNTGGMGAYSPAPVITQDLDQRVMNEIIYPTLSGLKKDGINYLGFLYAGLMIDDAGNPKVLEYNCRFGDPETQPIMMRLKSDFVELLLATINGSLSDHSVIWSEDVALGVVMAAGGYPIKYESGYPINGLEGIDSENIKVFHAGTSLKERKILTSGGRVLCVVGKGKTTHEAQKASYAAVEKINWTDEFHRSDIGYRAIKRE